MQRNKGKVLFEAKMILPEFNPDGDSMEDVHEELEGELLAWFQSYTVTIGENVTFDSVTKQLIHDDVLIYDVVLENTVKDINKMKQLAKDYGVKLGQDFVQFKNPNGEIEFLDVVE